MSEKMKQRLIEIAHNYGEERLAEKVINEFIAPLQSKIQALEDIDHKKDLHWEKRFKALEVENKDLKEAKIERISMLNKVAKRAGEDNELIIKLQAQLEKLRWIPVTERPTKKG